MNTSGQLKIDTPEQIALELPLAGIGSRFLAIAVDTLVQAVTYLLAMLALLISGAMSDSFGVAMSLWRSVGPVLFVLLSFTLYWGYFACFEIFWHGQTPGKRAAGIRVIKDSGRPLDASAALLRNLLRAVDFLPAMYGTGVVCMLLNRQSRRLGDFVAGTVVVHDRGLSAMTLEWRTADGPVAASPQAARLTADEVVLIETYLARRFDYGVEVQYKMGAQIARRIEERTGLQPMPGQSQEDFLQTVARQARDAARFR